MGIQFIEDQKLFRLSAGDVEYVIGIADDKYVGHVYFGKRLDDDRCGYLMRTGESPFVPSENLREKCSFADTFPTEYAAWGVGDYRQSSLRVRTEAGYRGCELHYAGYRILDGKPGLPGLPATFCRGEDVEPGRTAAEQTVAEHKAAADAADVRAGSAGKTARAAGGQTLEIDLRDEVIGLKVTLRYSIFDDSRAVIRSTELFNESGSTIYVEKVLSASFDMDISDRNLCGGLVGRGCGGAGIGSGSDSGMDMLTLHGSWARERHVNRRPVTLGRQMVSSFRGESGHQDHPFIAVMDRDAGQDQGDVYAMHFVYSGNFTAEAELNQFGSLRMMMGINPEGFEWALRPGETFTAPEVVCVYSDEGLGKMTRTLHDLYRNHLIRSPYLHKKRPILINNWEATYFKFNADKLADIAREAKKRGIEMLVMDDGWFGKRDSDNCSLGDWVVNEEKLGCSLKELVDRVKAEGLKFGIWFEPEMISPDSDLYRQHPDWAIRLPGRTPTQSRAQYVLDLSRPEVREYVYGCVAKILHSADISYVKWDSNRQLTDPGSSYLAGDQQGELAHRFTLGIYELQERLLAEFPDLLLENCCGGGARFDPGMLYYSPQIWCSDDTDAVERLEIQEGTAMLYPLGTMGAHVSDCPNHAVGRTTPFKTRGHVALAGTFGYELDITKISEADQEEIESQVAMYHRFADLNREGDYYRIASWAENGVLDCWQVVAKDRSEAIVTFVQVLGKPNRHSRRIRLKGLDPDADYAVEEYTGEARKEAGEAGAAGTSAVGTAEAGADAKAVQEDGANEKKGRIYSGRLLMNAGLLVPPKWGDFASELMYLKKI